MATNLKNLSEYDSSMVPDGSDMKIGIVVSEWNSGITDALLQGAKITLTKYNVKPENILIEYVPGSFELPFGARMLAINKKPDAIICLGCVIQGETPHFDYVCKGVTEGITNLNIQSDIPVIFGVLTTHNMRQARERSGGKHGNKGDEAAVTALKMVALNKRLSI